MAMTGGEQSFAAVTAVSVPEGHTMFVVESPSSISDKVGSHVIGGQQAAKVRKATVAKWVPQLVGGDKVVNPAKTQTILARAFVAPSAKFEARQGYSAVVPIENDRLRSVLNRLSYLAEKQDGWKGPNSVAMPREVRNASEIFLRNYFKVSDLVPPRVGLDADGDVTLFWKSEAVIIDLSIAADGNYSFYAKLASGETYQADEDSVFRPLPKGVLDALKVVTA